MTPETIFKTMQDLIAEQFAIDADEVTMDSSFVDDLGADSVDLVELVMAMEAAGEVESLHRPVGMKDGNEVMLLEKIADTGGAEEKILDHLLLTELIKELKKDERKLLYLRYFADKTQTEIGEELGISQVQVSRMEKKILKTMREHAKE